MWFFRILNIVNSCYQNSTCSILYSVPLSLLFFPTSSLVGFLDSFYCRFFNVELFWNLFFFFINYFFFLLVLNAGYLLINLLFLPLFLLGFDYILSFLLVFIYIFISIVLLYFTFFFLIFNIYILYVVYVILIFVCIFM